MTWTAGYVTEVDYPFGYYRELAPSILKFACVAGGFAPPEKSGSYLELGFGQGLSVNIHAAACPGKFWGNDFSPTHAAQARALASVSGSGAVLLDETFAELAARPDLPEFDIIGLHGVWTWVSEESRRAIIDIIRRKLRPGGIVYVSYNCFPGWAPVMPLRHLLKLHCDLAGSKGDSILGKVDEALAFASEVAESGAHYFRANPAAGERIKKMSGWNRPYIAHEYLNDDWAVMAFSEVARSLDEAKASFVASAHLLDHIDALDLTAEGQKLLAGVQNPILRQSVRDYLVNLQFRRDIFVKGPHRLTLLERTELMREQQFVLTTAPLEIPMTIATALGETNLQESIFGPVIEAMADDGYRPKSLGQLIANARLASLQPKQIVQACVLLTGAGHMHPAQVSTRETRDHCTALNRHICRSARSRGEILFLASPVTGGGVQLSRFQQLFLLAAKNNRKTPEEHAKFASELLAAQGERAIQEGSALQAPGANLADLTKQAAEFAQHKLPLLKAMEVSI